MSHYITAKLADGEEIELIPGKSRRTLDAIEGTGFDLYAEYRASHCDGGMSGVGGTVEVSEDRAREALVNAVAWALAILEAIDVEEVEIGEEDCSSAQVGVPVWKIAGLSRKEFLEKEGDPIPEEIPQEILDVARGRAHELSSELRSSPPAREEWERALTSVGLIVQMAWEVYQGTSRGPVEICFT